MRAPAKHPRKHRPKKPPHSPGTPGGGQIQVWEDDPESAVLVSASQPSPAKRPLGYKFPSPAPAPSSDTHSAAFRYWVAAEALRRGADFWAPQIASGKWQPGADLKVLLDEGEDLNAYYDRQALNFFHGAGPSGTVYSGASPDILCHEMGHAILDSVKPQLWGAASQEAAAFHESFGDMSAILSALQLPSLRVAILRDTNSHLNRDSRLSRLAEELGTAIRAQFPDAVDADSLRNAVNSFNYSNPQTLPSRAPASQLSSEAHSFSRVFTGAFFDALAGMLAAHASTPGAPSADELRDVSLQMRDILIKGVLQAPVVSDFYAQVAAGMVQASAAVDAAYPAVLKGVFVRRAILSLESAAAVQTLHFAAAAAVGMPKEAAQPLGRLALPAAHYGLSEPLIVEAPSQPRQFAAFAATHNAKSAEPASAVSAATSFVDELFANGRVDYNKMGGEAGMHASHRLKTHTLVRDGKSLRLARRLFDCGICGK